jgi:hypothetical protein
MTAIQRFRNAFVQLQIPEVISDQIFAGYEKISDQVKKEKRAEFFVTAMERMENLLDEELCHDVRDACACSKGGWRLKASQKIAREYQGQSLESKLQAVGQVAYMGNPVLDDNGRIIAGIGDQGPFHCPCPVLNDVELSQAVSKTYCYCCAGHFRFHYPIAFGKPLNTRGELTGCLLLF